MTIARASIDKLQDDNVNFSHKTLVLFEYFVKYFDKLVCI